VPPVTERIPPGDAIPVADLNVSVWLSIQFHAPELLHVLPERERKKRNRIYSLPIFHFHCLFFLRIFIRRIFLCESKQMLDHIWVHLAYYSVQMYLFFRVYVEQILKGVQSGVFCFNLLILFLFLMVEMKVFIIMNMEFE
jgi:hypothetical protein